MDIEGRYEESKNAAQTVAYRHHTNGIVAFPSAWDDNKLTNKRRQCHDKKSC